MKKLLILMLVLGMASLANATMTWSVSEITIANVGLSVTVDLISSDLAQGQAWVGNDPLTPQIADITAIAIHDPPAGSEATVADYRSTYPGWWVVETLDTSEPSTVGAGAQYTVTITGLALGTTLMSSDEYGAFDGPQVGNLAVTVIPEPMTIALLGLGGLFLLRRRK